MNIRELSLSRFSNLQQSRGSEDERERREEEEDRIHMPDIEVVSPHGTTHVAIEENETPTPAPSSPFLSEIPSYQQQPTNTTTTTTTTTPRGKHARRRSQQIQNYEPSTTSTYGTNINEPPMFTASVSFAPSNSKKKQTLVAALANPKDFPNPNFLSPSSIRNANRDMRESEGETIKRTPRPSRKSRRRNRRRRLQAESAMGENEDDMGNNGPADEQRERPEDAEEAEEPKETEEDETSIPSQGRRRSSDDEKLNVVSTGESKGTKSEEDEEDVENDIKCIVGKTALILHFTYQSDNQHLTKFHWLNELQKRTALVRNSVGDNDDDRMGMPYREVPLWVPKEKLAKEVADLNPLFRQVMGWKEPNPSQTQFGDNMKVEKTWTCHRLAVHQAVLHDLFRDTKLYTIQNNEEVSYDIAIDGIELLLYPLGSALLVIHVDWLKSSDGSKRELTLQDIRTLIYVSKYRQKIEGVSLGWGLTSDLTASMHDVQKSDKYHEYRTTLGELFGARYENKKVSLATMGNWLLHLPHEDPTSLPTRLDFPRHAYHHSTVVVDREPSQPTLRDYLFHLRRAFGQTNRPPPMKSSSTSLGRVLVWRVNRYIGLSREGVVSISWPLSSSPKEFEVVAWHTKFQGIYLLLQLHALAEKLVFLELSDLAAAHAEHLQLSSVDSSFSSMKAMRDRLRELSSRLVRYTISMSTNDCGGITEYSEFFSTLREVLGIPELREELSGELKDVLALLESYYLEEEKRKRDEQEQRRQEEMRAMRESKADKDKKDRQFEIVISIFGSLTLPFAIIGGIFGMNLEDLPVQVKFWPLLGGTLAFSIFFLIILMFWRWRTIRNEK